MLYSLEYILNNFFAEKNMGFKNRSIKIILVLTVLILLSNLGICQEGTSRVLKGKLIIDKEAIIGATILLTDEPMVGVITDVEGEFELSVPKDNNFKIHIGICICAKNPKDVKIKKEDEEILLKIKNCEIKKKTKRRIN